MLNPGSAGIFPVEQEHSSGSAGQLVNEKVHKCSILEEEQRAARFIAPEKALKGVVFQQLFSSTSIHRN